MIDGKVQVWKDREKKLHTGNYMSEMELGSRTNRKNNYFLECKKQNEKI